MAVPNVTNPTPGELYANDQGEMYRAKEGGGWTKVAVAKPKGTTSATQTEQEMQNTAASNTANATNAQPGSANTEGADPSGTNTTSDTGAIPLTGWAANQNFNPTELQHIYDNPHAILPYVFGGMQPGSPGYTRFRNLGWDPLAMMIMTLGSESALMDADSGGGPGGYANYLQQLFSQMGAAGGQQIDTAGLLRNIFGQGGTGEGNATTALGRMLGAGDATQQSRTLYNLIRDASEAGMNPLAGQGLQAATMNALDRYNSAMLSADSPDVMSAVDWINQNAPGILLG